MQCSMIVRTVVLIASMAACSTGRTSEEPSAGLLPGDQPSSDVPSEENLSADDPSAGIPQASAPVRRWGYITLPDGNRMRYSVLLPGNIGRYPVLIEYDGYSSGSTPNLGRRWLNEGYAVMGLNVPGTGCSTGDDRVFDASVGAAGAYAVEWAAKQPWSNGRIGMVGDSYAGYSQLWVAAQHPEHLRAIAPGKDVTDPYRDVGFPGGIPNIGFPAAWFGRFPSYWRAAAQVAQELDGDIECEKTAVDNIAKLQRPDLDWLAWLTTDRHYDGLYVERSVMYLTGYITIPTLGTQAWQDEQVGPRMGYYEETIDPALMWLISSNGNHETSYLSQYVFDAQKRFYAHFVKGEHNRLEHEPHVHLLQELQTPGAPGAPPSVSPRAIAAFDRLPVDVTPMRLWLQDGGGLSAAAPEPTASSSSYLYPVASPEVNNPGDEGWKPVSAPAGQATFTTAALPEDLSYYGEASADLWLSATDTDTDLQITLSEIRPDGMEMFVQRGWLRASKRQLDAARSTVLRPWGDFTEAVVKPLVPDEPTLVRVELEKFAHVFRAGSSLRVTIDTPSQTGYWVFGYRPNASTNTIWHDRVHGSSIVLGYVPYAHAGGAPGCATTLRQPCRPNQVPVPAGTGPHAPS